MFKEGKIDKIFKTVKKILPERVFNFFQPVYHWVLAWGGAIIFGFPSGQMRVIGITGTKGKSTVVYLLSRIFEEAGEPVAAIGSLGYKIKNKEWPNNLKMTMPGRFRLQKFLKMAKDAGVKYVILEVTSEGIKQKRHLGIKFDCAVLTNIHKEHIESHGSYKNYIKAKKKLFKKTKNIHILNADDGLTDEFKKIKSTKKIYYRLKDWEKWNLDTKLVGDFHKYNILTAAVTARTYGISEKNITETIKKIKSIPGRMEFIDEGQPFGVVVDYAHTPGSLKQVYKTLKGMLKKDGKLICVLGAAGGGRDKWKRPEFGKISGYYCDQIFLTDEDPYDEDPEAILKEVISGFSQSIKYKKIIDRGKAIKEAVTGAYKDDIVIITGKGSETSIAVSGGKKIPWSDKEEARKSLKNR